ncbi:hypothetical protein EDB81DRAFT_883501 [Dactylonectria macrodidyma]|uniref:Uncharacterized protein n=1 Tax=Dactylonectria macrodidyma TaxID=307937 RepID=A0A9P9EVJ1_9HYPO|nr:hypothetical protein EDB81DRAFT_883501 [Dactylonectria macrodidyma]
MSNHRRWNVWIAYLLFATMMIAALYLTYYPGRSESRFLAQRQIKVDSCTTGGFCVGGACIDNTIGVDVHNCGAVGHKSFPPLCDGSSECLTKPFRCVERREFNYFAGPDVGLARNAADQNWRYML